jgi:ribosomal protein S18 acetylase RimI-like enzyme
MGDIKIRKAKNSDINSLILIGKRENEFRVGSRGPGFWGKGQLEKWIGSKSDVVLVAEETKGNKLIGFAFFAHHIPTGKVTYENAWVDKDYRGRHIILELTKVGLNKLKNAKYVSAAVKEKNIKSVNFLRKSGFREGFIFKWMYKKLK